MVAPDPADPPRRPAAGVAWPNRSPWWQRRVVLALLLAALALPLWFVDVPPLLDLPGHMARYHAETAIGHSPLLQRNWTFHWRWSGNLGVELLMMPLAPVFGLERASWLIAAAIPMLMGAGLLRIAAVVQGRVPAPALLALPFTLGYPYQYGFLNYWLGVAIAFLGFAVWPKTGGLRRALAFAMFGLAVWLCHTAAWGILGVLVGGYEIGQVIRDRPVRPFAALATIAVRVLPLLLPVIPMIVWRTGANGMGAGGFFLFHGKWNFVFDSLRDQRSTLDLGSIWLILALFGLCLASRRYRLDPGLATPALLLFALFLLMPFQMFGSAYADMRLAPVVFMIGLLALRPAAGGGSPLDGVVAATAVALLLVRILIGTLGFIAYDREFDSHLKAIDHIRPGARIAALIAYPCNRPWRAKRLDHLPSLAVVRRDAFANSQWATSGTEMLSPRGTPTGFDTDPSQMVSDPARCPKDLHPLLAARIAQIPRDRFDYVWVLDFDTANLPAYPGLTPLYRDRSSILYAVEGRQAPGPR